MPLITDDLSNSEDATYINHALQHVRDAKDLLKKGDFSHAAHLSYKAVKLITDLVALRKEAQPEYRVLETPFYYFQGHVLLSYIENSSDVFGVIPPLPEVEESSESEDEEEAADGEDNEQAEAPKETTPNANENAADP